MDWMDMQLGLGRGVSGCGTDTAAIAPDDGAKPRRIGLLQDELFQRVHCNS